ncbi:MAG: cytochrome c biogenesis protein CcdA [Candidatus Aenigmarchaeota archaeon]|nr:cytochrome c biogenesis protein CcdA [Candidatus Aenigmarchaeota archaeon]
MAIKILAVAAVFLALAGAAHGQDAAVVQVSYLVAFVGGIISLLSPCTAAVLPAFFAYSFREKTQLVKKSFIFFIGLSIPLVLLGLSASVAGRFLNVYRTQFVLAAGALMIIFGIMAFLGKGFSLPGTKRLARKNAGKKGVFAFGALFGIGFVPCAGPILGSVLTLAATQSSALQGALLLEVYALGIMVPVFLLSYFFDKKHIASVSRTVRIMGREIYWTNMVSGVLFVFLGLMFIFFGGSNFLNLAFSDAGLLEPFFGLNESVQGVFSEIPDYAFLGVAALLIAVFYLRRRRSRKTQV